MTRKSKQLIAPKGLLLAVFTAAVVCAALMFLHAILLAQTATVVDSLLWAGLCFLGALLVASVVALPIFLMLRGMNLARWWVAAVTGAALGSAFAGSLNQDSGFTVSMVGIGMASAIAFWFTTTRFAD